MEVKFTKEEFIEYYINQSHTRKECVSFFGCSLSSIGRFIRENNIIKDQEIIKKHKKDNFLNRIPKEEELREYYINQKHSVKETADFFNASTVQMEDNESVVSYNDITKTEGKLYQILGFHCVSVNRPNYWWVNFNNKDIRTRYQEQAAGEIERMHKLKYYRICDCGTKTWLYIKNK